jgi:hypothetical protein
LVNSLVVQGRFSEAEKLARTSVEIVRSLGIARDTGTIARALNQLGLSLTLQDRWAEAAPVYAELEQATSQWETSRRFALEFNMARINTLYNTGEVSRGVAHKRKRYTRITLSALVSGTRSRRSFVQRWPSDWNLPGGATKRGANSRLPSRS